MLPRIWTIVLTVLLLAAPVGAAIEVIDAKAECAADEALLLGEPVVITTRPARTTCMPLRRDVPPDPVPARIFRPPRPNAV